MIWNEELSASLDQSASVIVFHRVELSRTQQLAQALAEKVNTMVEQSEKALDAKLGGGGGWGDRADGKSGEKRGEQTQERRGGRTRGTRGEQRNYTRQLLLELIVFKGGARGGRGARFAQGLGNQMSAQRAR